VPALLPDPYGYFDLNQYSRATEGSAKYYKKIQCLAQYQGDKRDVGESILSRWIPSANMLSFELPQPLAIT
jgi:hypothetical protein